MARVVNLHVHRNTRERRERRDVRRNLVDEAKELSQTEKISGYVVLVWDEDWTSHAHWDMGGKLPAGLLPVFAGEILKRHLGVRDTQMIVENAMKGDGDA